MKKLTYSLLMLMATFAVINFSSCKKDDNTEPVVEPAIDESILLIEDEALGAYLLYKNIDGVALTDSGYIMDKDSTSGISELFLSKTATDITDLESDEVSYAAIKITSFDEVQYFTDLTHLTLTSNELKSLDLSKNTALKVVQINFNQINSLDLSALTMLDSLRYKGDKNEISYRLSTIDLSNNTNLTHLSLPRHNLSEINISMLTKLVYVDLLDNPGAPFTIPDAIYDNLTTADGVISQSIADQIIHEQYQITDTVFAQEIIANTTDNPCVVLGADNNYWLDTVKAASISYLDVSLSSTTLPENSIKSFDGIQYFTALDSFICSYSTVANIDMSGNPNLIYFKHTGLSAAPTVMSVTFADPSKIEYFWVFRNKMTSFDATPFTSLKYLRLSSGEIATLTIDATANAALENIRVDGNPGADFTIPAAIYDAIVTAGGTLAGVVRGTK